MKRWPDRIHNANAALLEKETTAMCSRSKSKSLLMGETILALLVLMFTQISFASGPVERVIHSFTNSPDGDSPQAALIADPTGNLYGTTVEGGAPAGAGAVFELSRLPGGGWTEAIIYEFQDTTSGILPFGTLTFDKLGNLYGTTFGNFSGDGATVFQLTPPATPGGAWNESVLYRFPSGENGSGPTGKVIFDGVGNLYGTTTERFTDGDPGTVFQLKHPATPGGSWTHRILHSFGALGSEDGRGPTTSLVFRNGGLYGTTTFGGTHNSGTVFQLVPIHGVWAENILYNFGSSATDGFFPYGAPIMDGAGNLYGTTNSGGDQSCDEANGGCGTVFELSPPSTAGDPWQENILYAFKGQGDGKLPTAGVILDKVGKLYGTASGTIGRPQKPVGVVFQLKPPAVSGGAWTETALHHFSVNGDGSVPTAEVFLLNGTLYGTTYYGGTNNLGTVYSVVP